MVRCFALHILRGQKNMEKSREEKLAELYDACRKLGEPKYLAMAEKGVFENAEEELIDHFRDQVQAELAVEYGEPKPSPDQKIRDYVEIQRRISFGTSERTAASDVLGKPSSLVIYRNLKTKVKRLDNLLSNPTQFRKAVSRLIGKFQIEGNPEHNEILMLLLESWAEAHNDLQECIKLGDKEGAGKASERINTLLEKHPIFFELTLLCLPAELVWQLTVSSRKRLEDTAYRESVLAMENMEDLSLQEIMAIQVDLLSSLGKYFNKRK